MWRERLRRSLFPGAAERDEGFRREIGEAASRSLRIIGGIQIAISILLLGARFVVAPGGSTLPLRFKQAGAIVAFGIINLFVARWRGAGHWGRLLVLASAISTAAVLIWASLVAASQSTNPSDFIPGEITLVMLVMITIVPLQPWHTFVLGAAVAVEYIIAARIAEYHLMQGLGPDENYLIFVGMLTALSVGITAVLYAQRRSNYDILQQTVEAAEALRQAQTRILLSENASTLNRLAAAISHEMNNPLGALLSGLDTMMLLVQRYASASGEERPKLAQLQGEVRVSIQKSAERLKELIAKMQRFTDPDQGRMEQADINEILRSVASYVNADTKQQTELDLRLQPIPPVICRPQQLSAVFSNLLSNALNAVDGNGKISIATRQNLSQIEVDIEDTGRGMSAAEIKNIFEPDFKISGGRIAAGNWSMFNSRQIVREHGGDIRISSTAGKGTRVTVVLPLEGVTT